MGVPDSGERALSGGLCDAVMTILCIHGYWVILHYLHNWVKKVALLVLGMVHSTFVHWHISIV